MFGPVMAIRRDLLVGLGGFDNNALTEDFDLSVRLNKAGLKIKTLSSARAWTAASPDLTSYFRQRLRWTRGIMQVIRKNTRLLIHPSWLGFHMFSQTLSLVFQIVGFFLMLLFLLAPTLPFGAVGLNLYLVGTVLTFAYAIDHVIALKVTGESTNRLLVYPALLGYAILEGLITLAAATAEFARLQKRW